MRDKPQESIDDDLSAQDDIDEIFSHLEHFEPPVDFVDRVMDAIARLPLPQIPPLDSPVVLQDADNEPELTVQRKDLQPS